MSNSVDSPIKSRGETGERAANSAKAPSAKFAPGSIPALIDVVRSVPRLLPVGAGTKPRLSAIDCPRVSTAGLTGVTEYDPSEYTFTALAGTPIATIRSALKERGQYLPFDPLLVEAGATLGGTVAAGLSGPRRFRFGGIRDFILGVKFIDGSGNLLRMGGKVVKNAAGFDLPKFFVGSLGRLGVLVEITFKIFPEPRDWLTLKLAAPNLGEATRILLRATNSRWEPYAIDYLPEKNEVLLQLGGPITALDALATEILGKWQGVKLSANDAEAIWTDLKEFRWAHANGELVKVPLTPKAVEPFCSAVLNEIKEARIWISAGGNVAFASIRVAEETDTPKSGQQTGALDGVLKRLGLSGMTLRGSGPRWPGRRNQTNIDLAVKRALDSAGRFPVLNDE